MSLPVGALLSNSTIYYNHDHDICNIAINVDDTTLCSKWYQASDLWQPSELESDLRDTVGGGKKWLVDFNTGTS